jgi:hypothetical protein
VVTEEGLLLDDDSEEDSCPLLDDSLVDGVAELDFAPDEVVVVPLDFAALLLTAEVDDVVARRLALAVSAGS